MTLRRVGIVAFARIVVACALAGSAIACSSSHGSGDDGDAGRPGIDGAIASDDGSVPSDDAAIDPDRDGGVARDGGGTTTLPDGAVVPTARVGTPCTSDADCPGLFCSPSGGGFGYCSWLCGDGSPCPGDAVCATFGATYGYCMQRCAPGGSDCATGYLCLPGFAEAPVCYPGCGSDVDCPSGTMCGAGVSGVQQCYSPGAAAGDPCALTQDCPESGYCLDEQAWGTPHGLCVTFCDLSTGAGCTGETTCVAWGFDSGAGTCIPTCDDARPCRAGYACVPTGDGATSACVSRCTSDADCSPGHGCNFVTGLCG